jgi:hypothetical protein
MAEEVQGEDKLELTEQDQAVIDELNNVEEESNEEILDEVVDVEDTDGDDDSAEVVADEKAVEPVVDEVSPELAIRGQRFGIEPTSFKNSSEFNAAVTAFEQKYLETLQYQQRQQAQADGTDVPSAPEFKLDLGDDYDEGLQEAINKQLAAMQEFYDGQLSGVTQQLQQQSQWVEYQRQAAEAQQVRQEIEAFDEAISSLDRTDVFGEGSSETLGNDRDEMKARQAVYDQAIILRNGHLALGKQPPELKELVRQADSIVHADEIKESARRQINDRLRRQGNKRLGSGSTSKRQTLPSDDIVDSPVLKEAWESYMKDNGTT